MKRSNHSNNMLAAFIVLACLFCLLALPGQLQAQSEEALKALLPDVSSWSPSEESQTYFPENLFEYINGAAEIYLSYDFQELIVAQYQEQGTEGALAVEIYDMGTPSHSFGIYSAERYPENPFLAIGVQGYLEEGSLNFLAGRFYVKLLCFDCGDDSDGALKGFAKDIVTRVGGEGGGFPALLGAFPEEGLVANTEKYILNNVMGYAFLHSGYVASYELDGQSFDCFVIEGKDEDDARTMLDKYLEAKGKTSITQLGAYVIKDRYYHNIYVVRTGRYLCGVMKIKDGFEKTGERFLASLLKKLESR